MGMAATETNWTAEMVRALPEDGKRYECIDGELLVSTTPEVTHQRAVGEMYYRLRLALDPLRQVEVLTSPADIELEPTTLVQPDVFVCPQNTRRGMHQWSDIASLHVAIEVLSPSTARVDRVKKRRFFARVGVPQYWVVDCASEVIEVSTPADASVTVLDDVLRWSPPAGGPDFVLDLPVYFRYVATLELPES